MNIASYKPTYRGNAKQIRSACKLIGQARRPVILAGGGVVSSGATPELIRLAELMRIPVVMTLMGKGGFPSSHPLNLGAVGMHGARYANHALTQSDLIIAAGARFSDRVTGDVADFAPNAKIIHIDIDPAEIGKILHADVPIVGDLPGVLRGIAMTLMGKGGFPSSHPLNLGAVGMHGARYANHALTQSDLIIAAGARFSDRVTGDVADFAPNAKIIHIDIDPAEIGKILHADVPIVGDLPGVLRGIAEHLEKEGAAPGDDAWLVEIERLRARFPYYHPDVGDRPDEIVPERVMEGLSARLDPARTVVTTEVGQHQMWANQFIDREQPRTFLSSGGLGTMGFGFPAAIGAAVACPEKSVVCVAGDGSFQMNVQEMATAAAYGVPVKVLLMNNSCLGMVHQWQKLFYEGRYSQTELERNPDFVKLADAYGWRSERVDRPGDVDAAIERMLSADGPYLLEVVVSREQNVYPMVAPGSSIEDSLGAIDLAVGAVRERMLSADGPYLLEVVVSREQNVYPMVAPGSSIEDSLGAIDLAVGAVRVDMPRSCDAARHAVGGVSPAACSLGADDVVPGKENR